MAEENRHTSYEMDPAPERSTDCQAPASNRHPSSATQNPKAQSQPGTHSPFLRPYTAGLVDVSEAELFADTNRRPSIPQNAGPAGPSGRSGGGFLRPSTSPMLGQSKGSSGGGLSRMRKKDYQDLKELATYGKTLRPLDRQRLCGSKPGTAKRGEGVGEGSSEQTSTSEGAVKGGSRRTVSLGGHMRQMQPPSSAYPEIEPPPPIMMQRAASPPKITLARRSRPHTTGSMRAGFLEGGSVRSKPGVNRAKIGAETSRRGDGEVMMDEEGNIVLGGKMGGRYVGEMAAGVPEGHGQHWVPNASGGGMQLLYEGEWMLGVKMGTGAVYYRNGQSYTGDVVDGDRHGVGRMTYSSGDVYHGAWVHGRKLGYGIQFYADSTIYAGAWANDCREGMATFYWPTRGKKYTGEWVKNAPVCGSVESIRPKEVEGLRYPAPQRPFTARSENLDLPPLELLQPGTSVYDKVSTVRGVRRARPPKRSEHGEVACLRPFQIEALKHAYVSIAGGVRSEHRLRTSKLLDVCLTAGYHPDSKELKTLLKCLGEKAHGEATLSFDAFLEAILWLQM